MSTSRGQLRHLRRIVERARREQRQLALDRYLRTVDELVQFQRSAWEAIYADAARVMQRGVR